MVGTCLVPIFHTNFALPTEGGKIIKIDNQLYFARTYLPGCESSGNGGTTPNPSPPTSGSAGVGAPTASVGANLVGTCLVPIFHTNFLLPSEGGRIIKIDSQFYFARTYLPGCEHSANTGTVVATPAPSSAPNPSPAPTPTPLPAPIDTTVPISVRNGSNTLFAGAVSINKTSATALDALKATNLSLDIASTGLGTYVRSVAGIGPTGASGWQFAANGIAPQTAADTVLIKSGDNIQWFYGPPSQSPY